jgi:hypothetical protein
MNRRTKRLAGALAGLGLGLGLTLGATGTARADVDPGTGWNEIYSPYLTAQGITLCADDTNGSTALNNPAQLYHCHGYASNGAPQRWTFTPAVTDANHVPVKDNGHGIYVIGNAGAGHCLVDDPKTTGSPLSWVLIPVGDGPDFQLQAFLTDSAPECAAASNFSGNNNTRLVLEPCSSPDIRQLFRLG